LKNAPCVISLISVTSKSTLIMPNSFTCIRS
jgi:hypothetical protein